MRVALSVWNGRIAPVFDVSNRLQLLDIEGGRVAGHVVEALPAGDPVHKVGRLVAFGASVLICGAISRPVQATATAYGIDVIPFVTGDVAAVTAAWLSGRISDAAFSMPGYCGRRRCHGRRAPEGRPFRQGAPKP